MKEARPRPFRVSQPNKSRPSARTNDDRGVCRAVVRACACVCTCVCVVTCARVYCRRVVADRNRRQMCSSAAASRAAAVSPGGGGAIVLSRRLPCRMTLGTDT